MHDYIWTERKNGGAGARWDDGIWITFEQSNRIFYDILRHEGFGPMARLYYWGLEHGWTGRKAREWWNRHKDGRPKAV